MRPERFRHRPNVPAAGRFIGGVFGLIFFGIGLTVIISLWAEPFGGFGSPPLFFRVVGSFIALAFVTMGGTVAYGALFGSLPDPARHLPGRSPFDETATERSTGDDAASPAQRPVAGYVCPQCGAPLSDDADVSPHGDVKCTYCDRWFNIHGR